MVVEWNSEREVGVNCWRIFQKHPEEISRLSCVKQDNWTEIYLSAFIHTGNKNLKYLNGSNYIFFSPKILKWSVVPAIFFDDCADFVGFRCGKYEV